MDTVFAVIAIILWIASIAAVSNAGINIRDGLGGVSAQIGHFYVAMNEEWALRRQEAKAMALEDNDARAVLQRIKDECGDVCGEFEICQHPACASSVRAYLLAAEALAGQPMF